MKRPPHWSRWLALFAMPGALLYFYALGWFLAELVNR